MNFEIIDESEHGRFVIRTSGEFTVEDDLLMLKQLAFHPNWQKGLHVLVDHRQVSFEKVDITETILISDVVAILEKDYGASRCAIVTPTRGFGKVSAYKFEVDLKVKMTTKIFLEDDYQVACKWLDEESSN